MKVREVLLADTPNGKPDLRDIMQLRDYQTYLQGVPIPDDVLRAILSMPCECALCMGTARRRSTKNIENYRVAFNKQKFKRIVVLQRDGRLCVRCGSGENLTIDHIVPIAAGGTSAYHNLQTLCEPCNNSKGGPGGKPPPKPSNRRKQVQSTSVSARLEYRCPRCPERHPVETSPDGSLVYECNGAHFELGPIGWSE